MSNRNRNRTRIGTVLLALAVPLTMPGLASAHDDDLRNAKPRIGVISDDVARQRLKLAGVEKAEIVSRDGQRIVARGVVGGQPVTVHIDALRGSVTDAADPARMLVRPGAVSPGATASAAAVASPAPRGNEPPVDRARIADPDLMRDAAKPSANPP